MIINGQLLDRNEIEIMLIADHSTETTVTHYAHYYC